MKKLFFHLIPATVSVFLVLFSSCVSSQSLIPVKGTGDATTKTFQVKDFEAIDVSDGFDVILTQGTTESVVITAQPNLYDYIHVEVTDGTLRIYTDDNIMPTRALKARIAFKTMHDLDVSGGGDVTAETVIESPELRFELSGGGDLSSEIRTGKFSVRLSGGGDADLRGKADDMNIELSGGGDLNTSVETGNIHCGLSGGGDMKMVCNRNISEAIIDLSGGGDTDASLQCDSFRGSVSGGGNIKLNGQANRLDITINGGGDLNAAGFTASTAILHAGGGSDVHIHVIKELTGNISGGGDIYYSGSPEIVSIDARGGSEVHKE